MASPSDSPARLEVNRAVFLAELARMAKVLGRRKAGDAVLSFCEGVLKLRIGGAECGIPAEGRWQGEACVSYAWLKAIGKVPPPGDPIVILVSAGRMCIGSSSMTCRWQAPSTSTIDVTLNMGLVEQLRLGMIHSGEELNRSGLAPMVADARNELDKVISKARIPLAQFGVTEAELRLLVIGKLALGSGSGSA